MEDRADNPVLYSVRMHASSGGGHLCGAERMVGAERLAAVASAMLARALDHEGAHLENLRIHVESIEPERVERTGLLAVRTVRAAETEAAWQEAIRLVAGLGVAGAAVCVAAEAIRGGAAPDGGNMRGAMIIDGATGGRLEPDRKRGVRVTHMDLDEGIREAVQGYLAQCDAWHPRVLEALTLASKTAAVEGVIAELCISDDPAYTTGYVASRDLGYVRILNLKGPGDPRGGRAIFVNGAVPPSEVIEVLERTPYLVARMDHV
jgi:6-carboxyhexanoate--CoA ligase